MYMLQGGAVPTPRWILFFRLLQLVLAVIVIGLVSYSISVNNGGPLQPGLIALLIIAILTIFPILVFTTPLHISQRRIYGPRIALFLDGVATLFWLGAFSALAAYQRIFHYVYADFFDDTVNFKRNIGSLSKKAVYDDGWRCDGGRCKRAWETGAAATSFGAIEFILFLFTTLMFLYYYHCHMAGVNVASASSHHHKGELEAAAGGAGIGAGAGAGAHYENHENHGMHKMSETKGPTEAGLGNNLSIHHNGAPHYNGSPQYNGPTHYNSAIAAEMNGSGVTGNAGDYGGPGTTGHMERPGRDAYGGVQE